MSDDIHSLLNELADGKLSAGEMDRLRMLVAEDPEALKVYVDWMQVHALLALDFQHASNISITPPISAGRAAVRTSDDGQAIGGRGRWFRNAMFAAVAVSVVFAIALVSQHRVNDEQTRAADSAQTKPQLTSEEELADDFHRIDANSVAVLTNVARAVGPSVDSLTVGSPVSPGIFVLKSGLVQLEFLSGANVIIEGPAELELKSTKLIVCHRGKLRVRVPQQAKGFSVDTPHYRAVDLGTEFGVSVGDGDATEVHVFQGEVELFDIDQLYRDTNSSALETLRIGAGLLTAGDGSEKRTAANSDKFVDIEHMLQILSKEGVKRYAAWKDQSKRWQTDPNTVLYYNFEDHKPSARVLQNNGPIKSPALNGAIVGCRWTEGRWPGKSALEFKGVEDRVRLNIPGEFRSITLSCWVRIDGFDRRLSSLFMTDGHNVGESHWQFTDNGQLLLGVKVEPHRSMDYLSGSDLKQTDLGRWVHLACVYDDEKDEVIHFIDGARVYSFPISDHLGLRFGGVELGNWAPEDLKNDRIRNLNGRMDEFLLLDRRLSDDDIKDMYIMGRPN
jgi:hypothetical protein